MGENKGHSDKAPNYPELDDMGSAASRAGQSAGNQQSAGGQQDAGLQQDSSIQQRKDQQQDRQQGRGNQQSAGGQRQNQQKGGQHASGGTPALDDLNADLDSRNRGSLGNASQQMGQTDDWNGRQDKNR
jgi:hypothetical protein